MIPPFIVAFLVLPLQLIQAHGSHAHKHAHPKHEDPLWLNNWDANSRALVTTVLVTLTPLLLLSQVKALRRLPERPLMSFAVGTLLSDIFVHVLPSCFPHNHHASHEDETGGRSLLLGLIIFYLLDKLLHSFHPHEHHHHSGEHHEHKEEKKKEKLKDGKKRSLKIPLVTVLASAAHSWTDGLTLAISHHTSARLGISTSLAVLLHELPHRLGEFTQLQRQGHSVTASMRWMGVSVLASWLGCALGCWVMSAGSLDRDVEGWQQALVPWTAGGLMYTCLVGMLPELVHSSSWRSSLFEVVAFLAGVGWMLNMSH